MKNLIFTIATMLFSVFVFGQQSSFLGNLTDEFGHPIENAYVLILNSDDHSFVKGTITDKNGAFALTGVIEGDYIVSVDHVSMPNPRNFEKIIKVKSTQANEQNPNFEMKFEVYTNKLEIDDELYANGSQMKMSVLGYESLEIN